MSSFAISCEYSNYFPLLQYVDDENDKDCGRDYPADEEVDDVEYAVAEADGASAGEFVAHVGLFHLPAGT